MANSSIDDDADKEYTEQIKKILTTTIENERWKKRDSVFQSTTNADANILLQIACSHLLKHKKNILAVVMQ